MNEKLTENILTLLQKRPIDLNQEHSFISPEVKTVLLKNNSDMEYYNETWKNPLKVVLMGEVKAGKSTLLNAIVGEELSPVGVTETTAVIMEIAYGSEKEGMILKKDGTSEKMDIEELYQALERNRDNSSFYAEIEKIQLLYPLKTLKEIRIVDTPGIETITAANQETTKEFIKKADVVLWVLSVHHLGQVGIDEELMEVAECGKPIIMLVNRIDQANENTEDIMDFIDDMYGFYVEAAFPVSGFKAFEGKKSGNDTLYNESGLVEILNYLEKNIDIAAIEVKEESVSASVFQLVQKEIMTCKAVIEEISFVKESLNRRKEDTDYFQDKINSAIKQDAESWLANEFLQKEKTVVLKAISDNSKSILKDNTGEIKNMLTEYFSEKYVTTSIKDFWLELIDFSEKERAHALKVMGEKFKKEAEQHMETLSFEMFNPIGDFSLIQTDDALSDLVEGAKKGVFVGGAYGLAVSAYASVLGPYAAAVTIGTALGSVLPPVLIAGAVTGAAIKFVNKDKKIKELQETTYKLFEEIKNNVRDILNDMVNQLTAANEEYFEALYSQLGDIILKGSTLEELINLQKDMDTYIANLDSNSNILETNLTQKQERTAKIIQGNFTGENKVSQLSILKSDSNSHNLIEKEKILEEIKLPEENKYEEVKTVDDTIDDLLR